MDRRSAFVNMSQPVDISHSVDDIAAQQQSISTSVGVVHARSAVASTINTEIENPQSLGRTIMERTGDFRTLPRTDSRRQSMATVSTRMSRCSRVSNRSGRSVAEAIDLAHKLVDNLVWANQTQIEEATRREQLLTTMAEIVKNT